MSEEFTYVQSLESAERALSYDAQQSFGQRVLDAIDERVSIAQVSLSNEQGAQPWVVSLAPLTTPGQQGYRANTLGGLNPQAILDAAAIVEWGVGGSTTWALVDWMTSGLQFSIYASYIRLSAVIYAFSDGAPAEPRTRFSGHIAPGFSRRTPTRTIRYDPVIAGGGEDERLIPAYASVAFVSGIIADVDKDSLLMTGRGVVGGQDRWDMRASMAIGTLTDPTFMIKGFPLPMGTSSIRLRMTDAVGGSFTQPRIRYELALS